MTLGSRVGAWLRPLTHLWHNPTTLTGAVLTTSAALTMIGAWLLEIVTERAVRPYSGIILFLILPGVFVLGLVLIPAGTLLRRWRLKGQGIAEPQTGIDVTAPSFRRAFAWVAAATAANVVLLSLASYRGVEYMESVNFCGLACHTVMAPEYAAYVGSPHSRVTCTACHIGPGAPWFVRSKLSGVRQVFAVAFHTYSRPIPSPVQHLRPSRETCEQCHWPERFAGDRLLVRTRYGTDEASTPTTTALILKIGGRTARGAVGIHGRHFDAEGRVRYAATDGRRQVIPLVTYRDDDGKQVEYRSTEIEATPEEIAAGEHRLMDCVDCHNRPTHAFQLPEPAVDEAITAHLISRELPYIKKKGVELLRQEYPDRATGGREIVAGLASYYRSTYPEVYRSKRAEVEAASAQLKAIYERNVFPEMKLAWGTHPNNAGHEYFPGCFRCHDDNHKAADGRTITQDCESCHTLLDDPAALERLGVAR